MNDQDLRIIDALAELATAVAAYETQYRAAYGKNSTVEDGLSADLYHADRRVHRAQEVLTALTSEEQAATTRAALVMAAGLVRNERSLYAHLETPNYVKEFIEEAVYSGF